MRAKIIKIMKKHSRKWNYDYYKVIVKTPAGREYNIDLVPHYQNFDRWKPAIDRFKNGQEVWLDELYELKKKENYLDADSPFRIIHPSGIIR